jgi:KDO2-lipid IV(A) lauroyltransferase
MVNYFFSAFGYLIFRFTVGLFNIIPFYIVYKISDVLYYILYYLVRYRRKTVKENLTRCFPEMPEKERQVIEKKFYRHLCDLFMEGLKGILVSDNEIIKRYKVLTPESPNEPFREGKGSLFAGCHFNNWEYGALACRLQIEPDVIVFYKPIKNKLIESFVRKKRSQKGTMLLPISETALSFENNLSRLPMFIMISDQGPSNVKDAHSIPFFGNDTLFLHGLAKYAKKYNLPLYFYSTYKVKRGFYEVVGERLIEDTSVLTEREITEIYVRRLEKLILTAPEFWLWSHKRWKRKKEAQ